MGFLAFVPGLLELFGTDPAEILSASDLSPHVLDDPENTIPYAAAGRLLELAAERTRCLHFGLEIGKQIRTSSLGLLGELVRNAPTVGRGLLDFATHQHRHANGGVAYLLQDRDLAFFGYAVYQPDVPGNQLICDAAARGAFTLVCELAGPERAHGLEVLFSRSQPSDLLPYRHSFGVKLRFNAGQTAVQLPRSLLDRPVAGSDRSRRKKIEKRILALARSEELDTVTRLRRTLRIALLHRRIDAREIAAQLGMSRRTLHRRLLGHGLRFQGVLDETRAEFARQLLANTRLGIGEIAAIIGYAEPSVFTRSFTRWTGVSPSEWRATVASSFRTLS